MEERKFVIGERVRVLARATEESSRAGIISYIHVSENKSESVLVDVLYDDIEENSIPIQFIQTVLPFEMETKESILNSYDSMSIKEFGNQLFHLKDYKKAMEMYQIALLSISQSTNGKCMSLGASVIVFIEELSDYLYGIISSNDDFDQLHEYEVMLSNEEERIIHEKDLVEIPSSYEQQLLLRSLYSNLGKCAMKRQLRGWSVRYGSLTLVITRAMINLLQETGQYDTDPARRKKLEQLLIDALYFRSKSFLAASRPQRAMRDCRELSLLDEKKSKSLETEIMAFKVKRQKDNRKLAKEIAKWVDQSLNHSNDVGGRDSANAESDDIPLTEDFEENLNIPQKQMHSSNSGIRDLQISEPEGLQVPVPVPQSKNISKEPHNLFSQASFHLLLLLPPILGYIVFKFLYS